MHNILLGVTGSVAAIKTRELFDALSEFGTVRVVATKCGRYFLEQSGFMPNAYNEGKVYVDADEWPGEYKLGDKVLHIDLRRWASCLVLAPLDANTLAKLHHGMCDNLLTSVFRAWDWTKPVFMAPAMNTMMWNNPPTEEHYTSLEKRGVMLIGPVEKRLACDDVGMGAMAPIELIVRKVNERLRWLFPLHWASGIPINHHPGAFGFHRRRNHHTGIDLYCRDGAVVRAAEDGTVVKIDVFTGPKAGHDWWEETWAVMVEGASGVINYGELKEEPEQAYQDDHPRDGGIKVRKLRVGQVVKRGDQIGNVKRVLFEDKFRPDIPGHSTSMLHLELYKHGTREFADWHDVTKNPNLMDPTPYLMKAQEAPTNTLTWDNAEGKTVG